MRVRIRRFETLRSVGSVAAVPARAYISAPARLASPLHLTLGASPLLSGASSTGVDFWCLAFPHFAVVALSLSFGPSSDGVGSKRMIALRRPTMASADFSLRVANYPVRVALSSVKRDLPR